MSGCTLAPACLSLMCAWQAPCCCGHAGSAARCCVNARANPNDAACRPWLTASLPLLPTHHHHHRTRAQMSYPAVGHASAGGVNMEAQPGGQGFQARSVTLSYSVYFEQDFPWTKGAVNRHPKQVGGK